MADTPRRIRVLSIAHTAVSRAAGRVRYRPLRGDDHLQVRLIVPQRWHQFGRWLDAEPSEEGDIETKALPIHFPRAGRATWYLHYYKHLLREVRDFRPHVLHLWEEPWALVSLQASLLARWCNAALVLEVDQNILKRLPPPFESIRRHVLGRTNLLLSRSQLAYDVAHHCGYRGAAIQIGYGVDQSLFYPPRHRQPEPDLRVGYIGRLIEEKGVHDLIEAAAKATSPPRLTIVGEGPFAPALRALAARRGLADRVTFKPWSTADAVGDELRQLDLLVLATRTTPTVSEQFGRVIIEAQACGTPVIGSTCGAIPDIVADGGWIVPERDPEAIATLLDHLHGNRDEVDRRGQLGLRNVAARFTHAGVAYTLRLAWTQALSVHQAEAWDQLMPSLGSVKWLSQP